MNIEIEEQDEQLRPRSTWREYVDLMMRRKWVVAICLIVPLAAAIAVGSTRHEVYQGNAQVVLSRGSLANALTGLPDPAGTTREFQRIVATQAQIARSESLAQAVVEAVPEAGIDYKTLLGRLTVATARDANIVQFHVSGSDPTIAARLAAEYARQFVVFRRGLDGTAIREALTSLETQLKPLRADPVRNAAQIASLQDQQQNLQTLLTLQTANVVAIPTPTSSDAVGTSLERRLIFALLLGVLLAMVLTVVYENFDTRMGSPDELEAALGAPILGFVQGPESAGPHHVAMIEDRDTPEVEAFWALRANVDLALISHDVRKLMISSAVEQEGKSTTAANLAVAMARAGRDVILVDLDLRRPTLPQKFERSRGTGVTDVVLGDASLDEVLVDVDVATGRMSAPPAYEGSLRLLRSGPIPLDPGELLRSPRIGRMLGDCAERADLVLIDTPPILQTGDAVSLGAQADALLIVARLPQLRLPALDALARSLRTSPAPVLGVVVTGVADPRAAGPEYWGDAVARRRPTEGRRRADSAHASRR
jgi:non-specific protein-tyrosine kinase